MIRKFASIWRSPGALSQLPVRGTARFSALVLMLVAAVACSDRQVYDSLQAQQRSRCVNEPAVRYEECLRQAGPDYDEYEQKRTETRDGDNGR